MANSKIIKANPAISLLTSVIYKAARGVSKRDLCVVVEEYGAYLGVMECDARLVSDSIVENSRKTLVDSLKELQKWFAKMDQIAAN